MTGRRDTQTDARTAMMRCIEALAGCTDLETKRALWRAALKYGKRARGAPRGEVRGAPLHAHLQAGGAEVLGRGLV